jgi:hypothetical protein
MPESMNAQRLSSSLRPLTSTAVSPTPAGATRSILQVLGWKSGSTHPELRTGRGSLLAGDVTQVTADELRHRLTVSTPDECFLCNPLGELVYEQSPHFFAMLGLGPLSVGYSIVATKEHVPSMLDVDPTWQVELRDVMTRVRDRLRVPFGESVATEHGRVAACVAPLTARHEPHCLHAHRLLFPGAPDINLHEVVPGADVQDFDTFASAQGGYADPGQYLCVEHPDGSCQIGRVEGRLPRQFFRAVVARRLGTPELASWQAHPGLQSICDAAVELAA